MYAQPSFTYQQLFSFFFFSVAHHISVSRIMHRQLQNDFVVNQWASFMKLKQVNCACNYSKIRKNIYCNKLTFKINF